MKKILSFLLLFPSLAFAGQVYNSGGSITNPAPVNGQCIVGAGGVWTAGSCSGSGGLSSIAAYSVLSNNTNAIALPVSNTDLDLSGGMWAQGALTSTFTGGLVMDYATGFGRFSVGSANGFKWFTGGLGTTLLMQLTSAGTLNIGTPAITDTGIAIQTTGSTNSYFQSIMQNTSNGTAAEVDSCFGNDNMTAGGYQLCVGRNSSGYTGTGSFNLANAGFIWSNNGDLTLGTGSSNAIHFVVNSGATDALTISTAGNITATGSVTAPNFVSNVATGTAPFTVTSTTPVANLSIGGNSGTVSTINGLVSAGTNVTVTGSGTSASPYSISASGGSTLAFSGLTSATNSTAAMVVGTGASLATSGTGTIAATTVPETGVSATAGQVAYGHSTGFLGGDSTFTFNDTTKALSATTFIGALTGNASTATSATNMSGGAAGQIPYQTGAGASGFTAAGTTGQLLISGGTGSPTWGTSLPAITGGIISSGAASSITTHGVKLEYVSGNGYVSAGTSDALNLGAGNSTSGVPANIYLSLTPAGTPSTAPLPIQDGGTAGNGTTNAQTGTTYTPVLGDAGNLITMNNAAASTLTIPPNSGVAYPIGTVLCGQQIGAGAVTLTQGSGVTFTDTCTAPTAPVYAAQYATMCAMQTAANTWAVVGNCQ